MIPTKMKGNYIFNNQKLTPMVVTLLSHPIEHEVLEILIKNEANLDIEYNIKISDKVTIKKNLFEWSLEAENLYICSVILSLKLDAFQRMNDEIKEFYEKENGLCQVHYTFVPIEKLFHLDKNFFHFKTIEFLIEKNSDGSLKVHSNGNFRIQNPYTRIFHEYIFNLENFSSDFNVVAQGLKKKSILCADVDRLLAKSCEMENSLTFYDYINNLKINMCPLVEKLNLVLTEFDDICIKYSFTKYNLDLENNLPIEPIFKDFEISDL